MQTIQNKNITFVLQGPILIDEKDGDNLRSTSHICKKIRTLFPESKIIVSTWQNSDLSNIDCDVILENEDPGPVLQNSQDICNNVNRMIVSSLQGIRAVDTEYAVKMRTDSYVNSDAFIRLYIKYLAQVKRHSSIVSKPILTHYYGAKVNAGYALCDWFHFGKTSDLLNLWDIPYVTREQATYFDDATKQKLTLCRPFPHNNINSTFQYSNEQHLYTSFLKKNGFNVLLPDCGQHLTNCLYSEMLIEQSSMFVFSSAKMLDLYNYKYPYFEKYSHNDMERYWQICYNAYMTEKTIHAWSMPIVLRLKYRIIFYIRDKFPKLVSLLVKSRHLLAGFLSKR